MKLNLKYLCCTLAIAMTGCWLFGDNSSSSSVATATLSSDVDGGETGTATLTSLSDSTTQVAISTTGGSDTGVQSAVMRAGTCGSTGTIFAQLNNLQGRASITTLNSALSSLTGDKYYIDVHSSTDVNTVVACGEIP